MRRKGQRGKKEEREIERIVRRMREEREINEEYFLCIYSIVDLLLTASVLQKIPSFNEGLLREDFSWQSLLILSWPIFL